MTAPTVTSAAPGWQHAALSDAAVRHGIPLTRTQLHVLAQAVAVPPPPTRRGTPTTRRERDVLACAARGLDGRATAKELGISYATVRRHRDNAAARSGRSGTPAAIDYAYRTGALPVPKPAGSLVRRLSGREGQVLSGLARGLGTREIARELFLAPDTVKVHTRRLFGVLGVHDRSHAVAVGWQYGLLGAESRKRVAA